MELTTPRRISVVIIGYNVDPFVDQCIKSVLNQTYQNFEAIFIDDGSADETYLLAKRYEKDPRFRAYTKRNGGIISARKAGVERAKGDYICFIDGDDWINSDMLENLVHRLDSVNDKPDIVLSNLLMQQKDHAFEIGSNEVMVNECDGDQYLDFIFSDKALHYIFPKLFRRNFVLSSGYLSYPNVTIAEDWMTNIFFGVEKPRAVFSDTVNYYYRYNESSVVRTRDRNTRLLEQIQTLNYIELYFKEKKIYDQYKDRIAALWFSYCFNYIGDSRYSSWIKKQIIKKCWNKIKGFKNNPYSMAFYNQGARRAKPLFFGYCYVPFIMSIVDPAIDWTIDHARSARRKYRELKDYFYRKKRWGYYHNRTAELGKIKGKKAILIGTSDRSNIGDHIIALSECDFIRKALPDFIFAEITEDHYYIDSEAIKREIHPEDILFITGGGFLGSLWMYEENLVRDVIKSFPDNNIIILPQTIYFSEDEKGQAEQRKSQGIYNYHKHLTILTREPRSYQLAQKLFPKIKTGLFPDMALLLESFKHASTLEDSRNDLVKINNASNHSAHLSGEMALLCFRDDKERMISDIVPKKIKAILEKDHISWQNTSTLCKGIHNGDIRLEDRQRRTQDKIDEFASANLIVTDRLHGMIIAALAGTPCIAFDNESHKVSEIYKTWMREFNNIKIITETCDFESALEEVWGATKRHNTSCCLGKEYSKLRNEINRVINKHDIKAS